MCFRFSFYFFIYYYYYFFFFLLSHLDIQKEASGRNRTLLFVFCFLLFLLLAGLRSTPTTFLPFCPFLDFKYFFPAEGNLFTLSQAGSPPYD
jgi:hypothetical protein